MVEASSEMVECEWSPDNPDGCVFCSGEACNLCGAGCWSHRTDCTHDSFERHFWPADWPKVPAETGRRSE